MKLKNTIIILFCYCLMTGCDKEHEINSSIWYSLHSDIDKYQEFLFIKKDTLMRIHPLLEEGFKPHKKVIKTGKNLYTVDDDTTITLCQKGNKIILKHKYTNQIFYKYRELSDFEDHLLQIDSFFIRFLEQTKNPKDINYKGRTFELFR